MLKAAKTDLSDICDALESLHKAVLPRLTREEKVDVAARLRSAAKTVEAIDKSIKEEIKGWRKGKEGEVKGELFKAILTLVPTTRLNQELLKEQHPDVYEECKETKDQTRISFEVR